MTTIFGESDVMIKTVKLIAILSFLGLMLLLGCYSGNPSEVSPITASSTALPSESNNIVASPTIMVDDSVIPLETASKVTEVITSEPIPTSTIPSLLPTQAIPTITSTTATSSEFSDELFMFSSTLGFNYLSLNPFTGSQEFIDTSFATELIPGSSVSLSFDNHSNQVAFWVRNPGEPGAIWLADKELNKPVQVFVDENRVFDTEDQFPPKDLIIEWLPNDKFILIKPTNQTVYPILIDVSTLNFETWPLLCDSVINSPRTMGFALLCVQSGSEFLVMEWTGDIWTAPPENNYEKVWQKTDNEKFSFSVMGDQIAFVSAENPSILEIIRNPEEKISVELNVDELYPKTIRWTENDLIMVGGYREDWPASWFIIDSRTGNVIWTLEASKNFDLDIQQQSNLRLIEGEISALGEFIILTSNRIDIPSGNQLFLIDVTKNEFLGNVADIGHGLQSFSWFP